MDKAFKNYVKSLLRQRMIANGLTFADLADLLNKAYGLREESRSLANKVNRGSFSATFFIQALLVMDSRSISFTEPPKPTRARRARKS